MKILLKKGAYIFLMFWLISLVSFAAVKSAPNNFLAAGELNPNITEESITKLKEVYGLDKPLSAQYVDWVKNIASLEFGISFSSGKTVKEEILSRINITLGINISSMVIIFAAGLFIGIWSAFLTPKKQDLAATALLASFAMPSFYLALLLIIAFSINLEWFPISGVGNKKIADVGFFGYLKDTAYHLFLPITVIVLTSVGSMALYVKSLTTEILKSDYVFFALSRGADKKKVVFGYVIPNLMPQIVTMLGLSLPGIIGGSVILESIFAINGMGLLFYQSALSRDYPVILGITMVGAFLTLLGNVLADLAVMRLNPYAGRK